MNDIDNSDSNYNALHTAFVSNHTGTTVAEALQVHSITLLSVAVFSLWQLLFSQFNLYCKTTRFKFVVEYLILVVPQILGFTIFSGNVSEILGFQCLFVVLAYLIYCCRFFNIKKTSFKELLKPADSPTRLTFISNFRAHVLLAASICILAVDFEVYPRRFAKSETYGFGVIDVGVGMFIFVNAMTSPEARNPEESSQTRVRKAFKSSVPLVILGIGRYFATKSVNYHEHVSEYGTHWNFFLTLAVTKVCASVLVSLTSVGDVGYTAFFVSSMHGIILDNRLEAFIMLGSTGTGSRDTWVDANREGIMSLPGYIGLYLAGVHLGQYLLRERKTFYLWTNVLFTLTIGFIFTSFMTELFHTHLQTVSRRMCNFTYSLWVYSQCLITLWFYLGVDLNVTFFQYFFNSKKNKTRSYKPTTSPVYSLKGTTPVLFDGINSYGLFFFLFSNLLTGLVNKSFRTISMDQTSSMLILIIYTLIVCGTVCYFKSINFKFTF